MSRDLQTIIGFIFLVLSIGAVWYLTARIYSRPQNSVQQVETGIPIKLYYYDPDLDRGPGGPNCSRAGLRAVERVIPKTKTPLTDAIRLLLRGELADEEKAGGITTEFPLEAVELKSATISDGVATLTFEDPLQRTSGGSCRVSILWFQIEATAKQFPDVRSARFLPEDVFQP